MKTGMIVTNEKDVLQYYYVDNRGHRHSYGIPDEEIMSYDDDSTYDIFLDMLPNQFIVKFIGTDPSKFLLSMAEGDLPFVTDKLFEILDYYMDQHNNQQQL